MGQGWEGRSRRDRVVTEYAGAALRRRFRPAFLRLTYPTPVDEQQPVTLVLGPRGRGKSTLLRHLRTAWDDVPASLQDIAVHRQRGATCAQGLRIRYPAYAHPEAGDPAALADSADRYCADFRPGARRGACAAGDGPLQSGQAIMGHDAMLALVKAVEFATGPDGGDPVDAGAVRQMPLQLGTTKEVRGLSGPLGFDAYGNPKGRPMAYVELRWRSGFRYVHKARLWP
ncbi:hypothetical protein AA958_10350 [Streptomyces sp. CNQ-509]|uniref:hypothetical protein n=1 Tax=Streptomyces sp. CNQ-509 TaxID=444103 RepID=UPI00062DF0B1|nr:hypothetical protein [Streptomyces sp. CNQ-509]AKH82561.1 hypothetical protein AA958_10350 [Streptomyces sp. CNQ-509]